MHKLISTRVFIAAGPAEGPGEVEQIPIKDQKCAGGRGGASETQVSITGW